MLISAGEWLSIPKDERLLCIRLTVAENIGKQRKAIAGSC